LKYLIFLDFLAAKDKFGNDKSVIPRHKNVIQHFCNVEIYAPDDAERSDCLGWITLMPLADTDLRKFLKQKNELLALDKRKEIAMDLKRANDYLNDIGITHCDLKPENVLLKNGVPLFTDFGLVMETSNRISYRQLGYSRKGSKYRDAKYLCKLEGGSQYFPRWITTLFKKNFPEIFMGTMILTNP
jgi:serine/threonine protein kinase